MGSYLITESHILPIHALLIVQNVVSLKEFFKPKEIIFLIHFMIWENKFFVNNFLAVEECDLHHVVF